MTITDSRISKMFHHVITVHAKLSASSIKLHQETVRHNKAFHIAHKTWSTAAQSCVEELSNSSSMQ